MENGLRRILLALVLLTNTVLVSAAELQELGADTALDRREINEAMIDSENFEFSAAIGLLSIEDFGTNSVAVTRLAYHVSEDFFVEASLGKSKAQLTSYEQLSGAARLMSDDERNYQYYNLSVGYNILPGEAFFRSGMAFNNALYVVVGAGVTEFAGDEFFTINYGMGYRLIVNDWMALHFDSRDHVFSSSLFGKQKDNHNLEMLFGMSLFF